MSELRTMHLFAGIGGGLLADLILGHRPVVAVEWEPYACKVLRERAAEGWFPGLSVWEGDVRLFDPSEYAGVVDCIHAGFPCQDISVAGKQAGVSEGTRSGLYREVLRIAGVVRPRYLFLENVSAILSNGLGTVLADMAALGYDTRWMCIRASDVGAPHHRDRWFCFSYSNKRFKAWKQFIQIDRCSDGIRRFSNETISKEFENMEQMGRDEDVADTDSNGSTAGLSEPQQRGKRFAGIAINGGCEYTGGQGSNFWTTEPGLGRVANGIPNRVGQLKGYGNAQVPLQAAAAWKLLGGPT